MKDKNVTSSNPSTGEPVNKSWRRVAHFFLCLVIVVVGLGVAQYLKKTAPKAQRRAPERTLSQVKTITLRPGDHRITVSAMGSVVPARELTVKSRVSGQVQSLHPDFVVGGTVAKGQRMLKIDSQDYQLALARKESEEVNAQYELKVEMGYQDVAEREWKLLNPGKSKDSEDAELALRKPHLAKARSDLAAARAELEMARLDLSRTDITAPFNAFVREKFVEVGSQVSTQDVLAELVGTDEYWIRVSLPVDRLRWIHIPTDGSQAGSLATIQYRGHSREGRVIRMLGDLEAEGRMARILVSVKDPLGRKDTTKQTAPLLIGEYVRVEIQGDYLKDVIPIPRTALRDNDTVWLVDEKNILRIRSVETVWRDEGIVYMQNHVTSGDRLIVSDLAAVVEGMPVAVQGDEPASEKPAHEKKDTENG